MSDARPERKRTDRHLIRITTEGHVENLLFEPGKILLSETLAMEKAFDLTWPQIIAGLNFGRTPAIAAVVWVLRKRAFPPLRATDVDFNMDALEILDPDYLEEYGGLPEGQAHGDDVEDFDEEAPKGSPEPEKTTEPIPAQG